ncbi:MAG: HIT family protein [archaeon]
MKDCVFCKIVAGEIPCHKVWESEEFIVIEDANPKVDGHLLVISKRHFDNFLDLPSELYEKFLISAKEIIKKLGLKDFNLVLNNGKLAGQVVPHFHLHILPRRVGDGFEFGV